MQEYFIPHDFHHFISTKITVTAETAILLMRLETWFEIDTGKRLLLLVFAFHGVEHTGVHQVGDLFNHRQRVGNAANPELFPEFVDFAFEVACDHIRGKVS